MAVSIPEGYGAWGHLGAFSFTTTTTYSCHGVAVWNAATTEGGIYHVGANNWELEKSAMQMMLGSLGPTHCVISQGAWVAPGPVAGGLPNPISAADRLELLDEADEIENVCRMYCPATNIHLTGPRLGLRLQWTAAGGYQLLAGVGANFDVTNHGNYLFHYVRAGSRVGSNANGFFRSA